MLGDIKCSAEIRLGDGTYVAYLKEVATKEGKGELGRRTTTKAFIRKIGGESKG